jgi:hypothetical protein
VGEKGGYGNQRPCGPQTHGPDRIKEIAKTNADLAAGLHAAMDMMVTQSETLRKEIEKFRTEQGNGERRLPVTRQGL